MAIDFDVIRRVRIAGETKIVLLVMDGLGGLPFGPRGLTELEAAKTPNLDALAARGICGLHVPVGPGITPGSGPGHLALFGYDPLRYEVGRGVLSALGSDFDLREQDVAARGNFCTVDAQGRVTDRRAGRISTETNEALCERLRQIQLTGVEQLFVQTVKEHRFLLVLRGEGLSGAVTDTDPQATGKKPLEARATTQDAERTAEQVQEFVAQAREKLADSHPANMVLLRGFAKHPDWPRFPDVFGLRAAALADYPMYRGVAKLVGMDAVPVGGALEEKWRAVADRWKDYDFFFVHHKPTDSRGEDGDFDKKVREIEQVDVALPALMDLKPDVLVVTGDHSTPARLKAHSWHPVPVMIVGDTVRPDDVTSFGERACVHGGLGSQFPAVDILPLALAHAQRLEKFGA